MFGNVLPNCFSPNPPPPNRFINYQFEFFRFVRFFRPKNLFFCVVNNGIVKKLQHRWHFNLSARNIWICQFPFRILCQKLPLLLALFVLLWAVPTTVALSKTAFIFVGNSFSYFRILVSQKYGEDFCCFADDCFFASECQSFQCFFPFIWSPSFVNH